MSSPAALSSADLEQLSKDVSHKLEESKSNVGGEDMVEYVMLLVRNQRTQPQVVEELGMFFDTGSAANEFTEWLFQKLRSFAESQVQPKTAPSTPSDPPAEKTSSSKKAVTPKKRTAVEASKPSQASSTTTKTAKSQILEQLTAGSGAGRKTTKALRGEDEEKDTATGETDPDPDPRRPAKRLKVTRRTPTPSTPSDGGQNGDSASQKPQQDAPRKLNVRLAGQASRTPTPAGKRDGSAAAGSNSTVRCRFWPGCTAGESCTFHHPSKPCHFFPNCSYGQGCFNLHPPCRFGMRCKNISYCSFTHYPPGTRPSSGSGKCRFGSQCSRPGCSFAHPSEDSEMATSSSSNGGDSSSSPKQQQNCKFDPKCTKIQCLYQHPKREAEFKELLKQQGEKAAAPSASTPSSEDAAEEQ